MVYTRLTHFEKATRLKTNKNKMKNAVVLPAHVVVERALRLEDARCTSLNVCWYNSFLIFCRESGFIVYGFCCSEADNQY